MEIFKYLNHVHLDQLLRRWSLAKHFLLTTLLSMALLMKDGQIIINYLPLSHV